MADNRNWFLWLAQQGRELFVRRGALGSSFDRIREIIWKRTKSPEPMADPVEETNQGDRRQVRFYLPSPEQELYAQLGEALLNFDPHKVKHISDRICALQDITEARGESQYPGTWDWEKGKRVTFAFINGERNRGRIPPNRFEKLELVQARRLEKARQRKLKGKPARFFNVPPPEPKVPTQGRKVHPPEPKL